MTIFTYRHIIFAVHSSNIFTAFAFTVLQFLLTESILDMIKSILSGSSRRAAAGGEVHRLQLHNRALLQRGAIRRSELSARDILSSARPSEGARHGGLRAGPGSLRPQDSQERHDGRTQHRQPRQVNQYLIGFCSMT